MGKAPVSYLASTRASLPLPVNGQTTLSKYGQELCPNKEPTRKLHRPNSTETSHSITGQYIEKIS